MILQGTPPFMSHRILCNPDNRHTVADDLESFFYILLYITMMFGGPGQSQKKENIPYFIHSWLYEPEMRKIGLKKYAICSNSPQVFSSQFLVHVQDYFKEFIPCLERLHLIFHLYVTSDYDSKYEPTHEMFLKVFHETKAMAPFTEPEGPENEVNIKKSRLTSLGGCADIPDLVDKAEECDLNAVRIIDGRGKEALVHSEPLLPQVGTEYDFGPTRVLRQRKNKPVYTANSEESDGSSTVTMTDSDESYIAARSRSRAASKSRATSRSRVTSKPRATSKAAATSKSRAASKSRRNANKPRTISELNLAPKLAALSIAESDTAALEQYFGRKFDELGAWDKFLW